MKNILTANDNITSNSKQLDLLKTHFPQCFDKNGAFIPHKLQEIVEGNGIALSKEGYSLNWLGKSYARLLANENVCTLLKANTTHNEKPENRNSQNLLIKGDNLEVLKHLVGAYSEQIKMIYIDPPYNTGSDGFVYQDDRKFTTEQLAHLAGISEDEACRILEFTSSKSNSHSAWLTFMYPRLYIAKQLLREDGVIFISIDDNEQAQLKLLCDEIFGEQNFVVQFPWRKRTAKSDVSYGVSQDYEWVLVYANPEFLAGIAHERKYYTTPDFPNDRWRLSDLTTQRSADERPNCAFNMKNPKDNEVYECNPNRVWGVSKDTFDDYYNRGKIVFPSDYDFLKIKTPAFRVFESEDKAKALKKYGVDASVKAISTLLPKHIGLTEDGNQEIANLFGGKIFSFSKPVSLIQYFIDVVNSQHDNLVLDFFAGSGTTAHAVMQLNAEDGGNRQFICVQIDEPTDPNSEAHKAGYNTIYDITCERIKRAAAKIQSNYPDATCDFGFKQFETIPVFESYLDDIEELTPNTTLFNASTLTIEQLHDLMLTWQVMDGIPLCKPLMPLDLGDYTAYQGGNILYFMEAGLTLDHVITLLQKLDTDPTFTANHWVAFGYVLDSKAQREISEAIHYRDRKGTEITWDVRF
jgi:adenine-specific DNA-methyltransferase